MTTLAYKLTEEVGMSESKRLSGMASMVNDGTPSLCQNCTFLFQRRYLFGRPVMSENS